ncbi:MAG: hypothetical protein A3G33_02390 [Omnitrophica bacterium RIFCSPLOWO2_12_FULL_44_17]|uniref:YbgF trimerisation domain-containing protein n=1 Tax=Candidatus Danuiimicrobium aquiferis TaxID=1801832 RepID=A0A1G1L180_9BACT|nr:MAG: hypothetical protein A3B72_01970 [Omnitrophica bacterium RIFCSPHIGHO2_02_FULL_45_28]OGW90481.1 MAG: hypothetical protein A3E74_03270 [Omnitrophica bacterium RIFCSPHIGHO2_12_FULL_44_12]OGW98888.1 MAG: hypothetical protein A3G33_02390 [Omnitrophica bacterium RIFCSPLOWO2_12_FULL_44_17]OGX02013.1 MAG: hypothetical protein A3J12_11390 [Omnitrophica bacterium RIFCSPLOWO2_02_FULL_44_11]
MNMKCFSLILVVFFAVTVPAYAAESDAQTPQTQGVSLEKYRTQAGLSDQERRLREVERQLSDMNRKISYMENSIDRLERAVSDLRNKI